MKDFRERCLELLKDEEVVGLSVLTTNKEEITNNAAYEFLNLIPLIYFFYKKNYFQYVLLGIICLFMIAGMKRGAMLIGGISILFFIYSNLKGSSYKKKIIIIGINQVGIL